jgi:bacillopeptidase F (M6 metalloprotease family)
MGWTYGTPDRSERDLLRRHKDMIEDPFGGVITEEQAKEHYYKLDKEEQDKDTDPMECMLAMLRMFDGLRIYKLR